MTCPSERMLWKLKFYIHSEKDRMNSQNRNSGLKITKVFIIIFKYQHVICWAGYRFLPCHGRYPVFIMGEELNIRWDRHPVFFYYYPGFQSITISHINYFNYFLYLFKCKKYWSVILFQVTWNGPNAFFTLKSIDFSVNYSKTGMSQKCMVFSAIFFASTFRH